MDKPKIYATGNENLNGDFNVSYYIVEKDKTFLEWLGELLEDVLGIEGGKNKAKFVYKIDNDNDEEKTEIYSKEIEKMVDVHEKYLINNDRVDLFYGQGRVYLTFRKSRETRQKFARFLSKTKEWIEVKEVQKLPVYAGKRII